jgi:CopA family copper-resistance protein
MVSKKKVINKKAEKVITSSAGSPDAYMLILADNSMRMKKLIKLIITLIFIVACSVSVKAETVEYDLTISKEKVNITGESVSAMTINGGIPGPVLRFKEGDYAVIHVHNNMDVDTSIHWHGLLVPPGMDGVPYVSFTPIKPHSTFTYEFPIRQSGTYWYHSHTRLQEQLGMYGAIVIEDAASPQDRLSYDKEYTIVISDWTDLDPVKVLKTLRRGSHWFTIQKGTAQSLLGAVKAGMFADYLERELQRMPMMDIADVAYDRFLANGRPEIFLKAGPGEKVRLRIIDGSSTTYFHLSYAGGPMTVVSADGQLVEPVDLDRLLISVAETYDIIVHVPEDGMYELRATSHDTSGFTSIWLGSGERRVAAEVPPPNMYHSMGKPSLTKIFALTPAAAMGMGDSKVKAGKFDQPGMMGGMDGMMDGGMMEGMSHGEDGSMKDASQGQHTSMTSSKSYSSGQRVPYRGGKEYTYNFVPLAPDIASRGNLVIDGTDGRPWPPYEQLRSVESTAFDTGLPVREIRLTLDGDMERFVWFLNNQPLSAGDIIHVRADEITRFILINRTMMHHPMHLHGQFFRVINGQGDHAPFKHTVNVAPMSTTVFEINGSETGDWFFHCHLLYHMESGMANVVHYENFTSPRDVLEARRKLFMDNWYAWADADILTNMTEGFLTTSNTLNILKADWEVGWEEVEDTEWETTLTYERFFNRFFRAFVGGNFEGEKEDFKKEEGVAGIRYTLPLNIHYGMWIDTRGEWRFMLERELALTPRLELIGETEYDTAESKWEGKTGLAYRINRNISVLVQWHSEYGWGSGGRLEF